MAVRRRSDAASKAKPRKPIAATSSAHSVRVFISYSHKDDGARTQLDVHMAQLKREGVAVFFDGDLIPGTELDPRIRKELRSADIFVALASAAYLHSRYCFEIEYGYALRKAKRGKVHLVVALLEECQWRHTRMAHYKLLPKDGKQVSKWRPKGEAFEDIVNGLRGVVRAVKAAKTDSVSKIRVRKSATTPSKTGIPPRGLMSERAKADVVEPGKVSSTTSRRAKVSAGIAAPSGRRRTRTRGPT